MNPLPPGFFTGKPKSGIATRGSTNLLRKDGGGMAGGKPSLSGASKSLSIPALDGEGFQDEWSTTELAMIKSVKAAKKRASP